MIEFMFKYLTFWYDNGANFLLIIGLYAGFFFLLLWGNAGMKEKIKKGKGIVVYTLLESLVVF